LWHCSLKYGVVFEIITYYQVLESKKAPPSHQDAALEIVVEFFSRWLFSNSSLIHSQSKFHCRFIRQLWLRCVLFQRVRIFVQILI
jgi:hypothetical protein